MKFCHETMFSVFIILSSQIASHAQVKSSTWQQKTSATSTAHNGKSNDSQLARQNLSLMLDTVNSSWFGETYSHIKAVEIKGILKINLKAAYINEKIKQVNYSNQKSTPVTEDRTVDLNVTGTYFANADFRMELSGGFGNLIYYRVGDKGFLYSREHNAWTSRVAPPPFNAPKSFMVWFRQCTDEIQKTYFDKATFRSSIGKGTDRTQTITFASNTTTYNSNQRDQDIDESLNFWKHGKVEITLDNTTHQPKRMHYSNESQGIDTDTIFHYSDNGRPSNLSINNKSKDMRGPMSLNVSYDNNGLMNHIIGKTTFGNGSIQFNLWLNFVKDCKADSIRTVPPPTAIKKSREELEMLLLVRAGTKIHELQQSGLGIRGPKVINKH